MLIQAIKMVRLLGFRRVFEMFACRVCVLWGADGWRVVISSGSFGGLITGWGAFGDMSGEFEGLYHRLGAFW